MSSPMNRSTTTVTSEYGSVRTIDTYDIINGNKKEWHTITTINGIERSHKIEHVDLYAMRPLIGVHNQTLSGVNIVSNQTLFGTRR